jgi:predicted DNA-binding protein
MTSRLFSLRLSIEDRWRLNELSALCGTTPSEALRQLLRAAIPTPKRHRTAEQDARQLALNLRGTNVR